MNKEELNELLKTVFCPICGSENIVVLFTNDIGEEVSFAYVNSDYFNSDYVHICHCEECNYEDVREFFDYKLRAESLNIIDAFLIKDRNNISLDKFDEIYGIKRCLL